MAQQLENWVLLQRTLIPASETAQPLIDASLYKCCHGHGVSLFIAKNSD